MKQDKYQRRFYRDGIKSKDLFLARITVKETDLQILADKPPDKNLVKKKIYLYRRDIQDYISKDRRFLTALKPIQVALDAPPIVKKMSEASQRTGVGPMASVAGAIAQFLGRDLLAEGYKEVIIENGGDIFLVTRKTRIIRIHTGLSKLWKGLSLKIKPKITPIGICTSSGKLGHSLSFGRADSVTILSKNAALADAVATAACNRINSRENLRSALDFAYSIKGISGAVIIFKNNLISRGEVEFLS